MSRKMFFTSAAATDPAIIEVTDNIGALALVWPWLLVYLDDWGRGFADPRIIKASALPMFPITEEQIAEAIDAFADAGLLTIYQDDRGRDVISVDPEAWWKYQTHVRKTKRNDDSESSFPRPPTVTEPPPSDDIAENRAESRQDATTSAESRFTTPRHATPRHAFTTPRAARDAADESLPRVIHKVARELGIPPNQLYVIALDVTASRQAEGYEVEDVRGFAISLVKKRDAEVLKRARNATPTDPDTTNLLRQLAAGKSIDEALA